MRKFKIDWKTFHSTFPLFTYPLHNVFDKTGNVHICKSIERWKVAALRFLSPLLFRRSNIPLKISAFHHQFLLLLFFPLDCSITSSQLIQTIQSIQINYRIEIIFPTTKKSFDEFTNVHFTRAVISKGEKISQPRYFRTLELSMFKKIGLQLELFIIVDAGSALDYNGFTRERENKPTNPKGSSNYLMQRSSI